MNYRQFSTEPKKKSIPKINITFNDEDSKYEGKPLIKPKNPYKPKLEAIRRPDAGGSFLTRAFQKT